MLNSIVSYLSRSFYLTLTQLIALLAIFFILGGIMYFLEKQITKAYLQSFGKKAIYWTAIIGTPLHELGHLVFCLIFRHKITSVAFLKIDQRSGKLGYVNHQYNRKSLWQAIGNFFIGAGPIITGSLIIFLLFKFLMPQGEQFLGEFQSLIGGQRINLTNFFIHVYQTMTLFLKLILNSANLFLWQFWLFLYLTFAITSHIAPSPEDFKGIKKGFFTLIVLLFVTNLIALLLQFDFNGWLLQINRYTGFLLAVFFLSVCLSLFHYLVVRTFTSLFALFKK